MTDSDEDVLDEAYEAYVLDDLPRVHLEGGHAVLGPRRHPRQISPFWLIPAGIIFFLVGLLIGARSI